jgi:NhaA family Na+:H+ antiporter
VRSGIAAKPAEYSWRQLCGAGALAGIGFTMSLFIAGASYPDSGDFAAAKIAIIVASLLAGSRGAANLWPREAAERPPESPDAARHIGDRR